MDPVQKQFAAETKAVGDRQVRAVISTRDVDRDGDVIQPEGISLTAFRKSPTVLFNHNPNYPVARATKIGVEDGKLQATMQFPPEGTSKMADEVYNLVKAGVLNSTSIGFMPRNWERLEDDRGTYGRNFTDVELLEFSVVSVPSNRTANIIERQFRESGKDNLATAIQRALEAHSAADTAAAPDANSDNQDTPPAEPETPPSGDSGGSQEDPNATAKDAPVARLSQRSLRRARLGLLKLQAGVVPGGAGDHHEDETQTHEGGSA